MRDIKVSTAVFAKIWSHRRNGEETENDILSRLLGLESKRDPEPEVKKRLKISRKIFWRDDVKAALVSLGGEAVLDDIYEEVRKIRLAGGRTLPENFKAVVRKELEYNSSDSNVYQGRFDWFRSVDGIGGGVWALRRKRRKT